MQMQRNFNRKKIFLLLVFSAIISLQIKECETSTNQPSLEFLPSPPEEQYERNLLHFIISDYDDIVWWKNHTIDSLKDCMIDLDCKDKISKFEYCTEGGYYGNYRREPCVFLKLNIAPEWTPEFYSNSSELPNDAPKSLLDAIDEAVKKYKKDILWVTCEGENPSDKEFIGPLRIYANHNVPGYTRDNSGTYLLKDSYLAVHFKRITFGIIIHIECRLWAKNIEYDPNRKLGVINFKLWMDVQKHK